MPSRTLRAFTAALMMGAVSLNTIPASAESLNEALSGTYTSNPQLLADRARQRATDEQVSQAVSGWRPSVTVQGTWSAEKTEATIPPAATQEENLEPLSGTVTAVQPIFQGGRVLAQTRAAKASVRAGRAQLTGTEQTVLLNAVTAYVDVVRDESTVELSKNLVEVLARQLQATRDRFEVGEITRTDVAQAEARLSGAQSALVAAQARLTQSRTAYERTIGNPPVDLDRSPPVPALPASQEEALEAAMQLNPSLIVAREQEIASSYNIDLAIGGLLPTLSVQGSFTKSDGSQTRESEVEVSTIEGVLTVPLYQGGVEYSAIREAKQTNSQRRLLLAQSQREVIEAVKNTWDAYLSAKAASVSNREQVRANEIALEGVQQEAQVGARTTLDVLDAEQELRDSRVALVTSQRDEIVAAYSLLAAVGGLTAQGLALPVEIYDPVTNYDEVSGSWIGFGSSE
ncbi:MAG: TolC family outer membrane protein [Alphaproteobacteria bacterium]|nr:TolC family outer membrane protein [Alphaproteobacteria bacterium]